MNEIDFDIEPNPCNTFLCKDIKDTYYVKYVKTKRTMTSVTGSPLKKCVEGTGWRRDGYCSHRQEDGGKHLVCAVMTDDFLSFTKGRGNDLTTPLPPHFGGLKEGDTWCICAGRYSEARREGRAPKVVDWGATHEAALGWREVREAFGKE